MISAKNKREITYNGTTFYWYVRMDDKGHRIHILSEDKHINLEYPLLDTEISVTPCVIKGYLKEYFAH